MRRLVGSAVLLFSLAARAEDTRFANLCDWLVNTLAPNYREIINRQPNRVRFLDRETVREVLRLKNSTCRDRANESRVTRAFAQAVENHSNRVGVLLPLTGPDAEKGLALKAGLEAAFTGEAGKLVFQDSQGTAAGGERALAELLFRGNVALVVAGGSAAAVAPLVPWADALLVPLIVLAGEKAPLDRSRFAFRVYPRERDLAEGLALGAKNKGWQRVAVLRPDEGFADGTLQHFTQEAARRQIALTHTVEYRSGDFPSMEGAVRQLFGIDPRARRDEYDRLLRSAQRRAADSGVPFDPRSVILKPIVETDAVLIPDNFRIVRHFAKLMEYHGVRRMGLLGDTQWRSPGLVDPPEPFLEGSIFADFIGSYDALPQGLAVPGKGYFAEPQAALLADFGAIGWRAGRIASEALRSGANRRRLPETLSRLPSPDPELFGSGTAFDGDRQSLWPVFLFSLGPGEKMEVTAIPPRGLSSLPGPGK